MNQEFPTVCISGSMRFYKEMIRAAEILTERGEIVLMPFATVAHGSDTKAMLDRMHFVKIDASTRVYVICPGNYMGESTLNEIDYAERHHVPVVYVTDPDDLRRFL